MQLGAALDRQIFSQQNSLRLDPKSFIPHLEKKMKSFNGLIYVPGGDLPVETTTEGGAAIQEAI